MLTAGIQSFTQGSVHSIKPPFPTKGSDWDRQPQQYDSDRLKSSNLHQVTPHVNTDTEWVNPPHITDLDPGMMSSVSTVVTPALLYDTTRPRGMSNNRAFQLPSYVPIANTDHVMRFRTGLHMFKKDMDKMRFLAELERQQELKDAEERLLRQPDLQGDVDEDDDKKDRAKAKEAVPVKEESDDDDTSSESDDDDESDEDDASMPEMKLPSNVKIPSFDSSEPFFQRPGFDSFAYLSKLKDRYESDDSNMPDLERRNPKRKAEKPKATRPKRVKDPIEAVPNAFMKRKMQSFVSKPKRHKKETTKGKNKRTMKSFVSNPKRHKKKPAERL